MRNTVQGAGSKVSGRHAADAGCLVPEEIQALADGMDISLTDRENQEYPGAPGGHPGRPAD